MASITYRVTEIVGGDWEIVMADPSYAEYEAMRGEDGEDPDPARFIQSATRHPSDGMPPMAVDAEKVPLRVLAPVAEAWGNEFTAGKVTVTRRDMT